MSQVRAIINPEPILAATCMLPLLPRERLEIGPGAVHIPSWLSLEQQRSLADACRGWAVGPAPMRHTRRLGMHQDKDERSAAPVVSISLGDTCVFRFGNTINRGKPYTDVELMSGDLFVFGGASRFAFHGVPKVYPGTSDPALGLTGRLNITTRVTGLSK